MAGRARILSVLALGGLAGAFLAPISALAAEPQCGTIPACVKQLRAVAKASGPYGGMGDDEESVLHGFQSLGPEAIPALLELLTDQNRSVRTLAGYCLRDMPGIGPGHLPAFMRAVENGDGWLPYAIGKIGTPEALEFLLRQLRKDPEDRTQFTAGLARIGARAAPRLAEFFRCGTACDERLLFTACSTLEEMEGQAAAAVPILQSVAGDPKASGPARPVAIQCLGRMHGMASAAVPTLLEIAVSGAPELQAGARAALLDIGGPGTRDAIVTELKTREDKFIVLMRIAALRERAHELGPEVLQSLSSNAETERVSAAYALGRIGYTESWGQLVAALRSQDDPLLAGSAAESLGRLKVQQSRAALADAANSYWFPKVRLASRNALSALDGSYRYPESDRIGHADTEFSAFWGSPTKLQPCATEARFPKSSPDPDQLDARRAKGLVYDAEVVGFGEKGRVAKPIKVVPQVGVRVANGWLLGADRGEWGGELVLRPAAGPTVRLVEDNIRAVFRFANKRIVAVAGLGHIIADSGRLYEVSCERTGSCSARWWRQLPGSPGEVWMLRSGELLVNTSQGSVVIDEDGRMAMAACHESAAK